MVGPGEVDDDLEGETQGECERFGPVRRCLIYEIKVGLWVELSSYGKSKLLLVASVTQGWLATLESSRYTCP